ncbi:ATP-dependent nuclease [Veillonella sp.]
MFMEWIQIENYRNLVDVELHFHNDINYFVGENAVGKSNFLDLLEQMINVRGFQESDFADVNRPIRIECKLSFSELTTSFQDIIGPEDAIYLRLEQVVQEVYPRLYKVDGDQLSSVPLSMLRHALYMCHRDTSEAELYSIPTSVYMKLGKQLVSYLPQSGVAGDETVALDRLINVKRGLDPECVLNIQRLVELLTSSTEATLIRKYSIDNVRLIMAVALKILAQIYMKVHSAATNLESLLVYDSEGRRYLPVFISVDEPELHLSPYLQRAVLSYYRQIATNENPEFLALIKQLFQIDGLLGQLFVVTHSTDALVDDYRHIIRMYRNEDCLVRAACGVTFKFAREVEKHLIMHFPEAKEALYARCIILVEGETEYGSFAGMAKKLNVDFDYFGICLINARGESSISKLHKLFKSFSIPTVALYDRDVMDKHSKAHANVFYTNEICFEMDVVSHLIHHHHRDVLDMIVQDIIDTGRGMVTKDMARRGFSKLGVDDRQAVQRCLKNIKAKDIETLLLYYFSWFYSNKGVIVGRRIAHYIPVHMIPPAFIAVIERAKVLSLESSIIKIG